jgi:hypothetical protein
VLRDPDSLDLAAIGAPASLQALVSARLDTLSGDQRRVVDRASVAGDSVEPVLLAELCPDVPDLQHVLAGLVRAQILRVEANRLSSEQGRYQFVQSAVRQVAYGTLSRRDRKQAHLDVLAAMLRQWSDELAPVVAQHCIAAVEAVPDDPDVDELNTRAVGYLRQAADRARSLGSPKEAAGHLVRALELASDPADRPGLELDLAESCQAIGRYDESIVRARSAQAAFAAAGDLHHEALAAALLSRSLCIGPEEYEAAVNEIEPYYRRLKDTRDELPTLSRVLAAYNVALGRAGRDDAALGLRQLDIAERLDDQSQIARALIGLSVTLLGTTGRLMGVLALEKAVAVARDSHDLVIEAHALGNWSSNLNGVDARRALEVGHQAVEVATRSGNIEWINHAYNNQALARWAVGDWDEVVAAPAGENVNAASEAFLGTLAGLVLAARGEDPTATTALSAHRVFIGYWWTLGQAITQAYAGDPEATGTARTALDEAYRENLLDDDFTTIVGAVMDVSLRFGDRDLLARTTQIIEDAGTRPPAGLRGSVALWAALAAPPDVTDAEVEEQYTTALREYDAWGSPVYVARAQAAYGTWLSRQGRIEEAEPLLGAARETYDALGAVAWLAELEGALTGAST